MDNDIKSKIIKDTSLVNIPLREGKQSNDDNLQQLLSEVRNIRFSEKVSWEKMLAIFKTSVDFNPEAYFLASMQNKMHYATHGYTAAEIIYDRADATKPYMGLTTWSGNWYDDEKYPTSDDVCIGKNYLTHEELDKLHLLVTCCLEFVEIIAQKKTILSMLGWRNKINMLLSIAGYNVMPNNYNGNRSREEANKHAQSEYKKWISSQNFPIEDIDF